MTQENKRESRLFSMFNEEELNLCNTLINFDTFVNLPINYPSPKFPICTEKKRRSNIIRRRRVCFSSLSFNHLAVPTEDPPFQTRKLQAASPASPLSFCNGDSENPDHSSNKRVREESMPLLQELKQTEEILFGNKFDEQEVQSVRNGLKKLELKPCKEKIILKKGEEVKNRMLRNDGPNTGQLALSSRQQKEYVIMKQYQLPFGTWKTSSASPSSLRQPMEIRGNPGLNVYVEKASGLDSLQPLDYSTLKITRFEVSKQKISERKIIITEKQTLDHNGLLP